MDKSKRRYPRLPLDVQVNYDFNAFAHSKDISEGGVCLITEHHLGEGKMLNLVFYLPERDQPIASLGKVMWVREATEHLYESGVTFWDIVEKDQAEIKEYLTVSAKKK